VITELLLFDLISEKIAMTGHRIKLPNARMKDGKLEIDPPRKKLPPHVKAIKAKKKKWKAAR